MCVLVCLQVEVGQAQCTLHAARCTAHIAHCTAHIAHCTLHTAHCTLHSAHCTLHAARCTLHSARCTLHAAHCALHSTYLCTHAKTPGAVESAVVHDARHAHAGKGEHTARRRVVGGGGRGVQPPRQRMHVSRRGRAEKEGSSRPNTRAGRADCFPRSTALTGPAPQPTAPVRTPRQTRGTPRPRAPRQPGAGAGMPPQTCGG